MPRPPLTLLASSILALAVAGCSGSAGAAGAGGAATATPTTAQPSTVTGPVDPSSTASPATAAEAKVSANTASEAEIAAALAAAGVPNPDRWAREVTEYRPYPTDDPTLAKLQDNLAKYQPDPATLAGILGALQP